MTVLLDAEPEAEDGASVNEAAAEPEAIEEEAPLPVLRTAAVVATTVLAAGVVVGSMFKGVAGNVQPAVAALAGIAVAVQASKRKRAGAVNAVIPLGLLAIGLALLASAGIDQAFNLTAALREARKARGVMRPPAEYLPGFRFIVGLAMGGLGFAAGWLAVELRRPAMGLLAPLPLLIVGAVSVPSSAKLAVGVAVLVLFVLGLALLSSLNAALAGADRPSVGYELRRAARAVPLLGILVVGVIVLARSNLLFPPPLYDPVRDAQRPKAVPLSEVEDVPLFEVRSRSTGPWRIGLLDVYDGKEWRIPAFAENALRRVPRSGVIDPDREPAVRADFLVKGLTGAVLPGVSNTVSLVARGPALAYDQRTGAVRLAEGQIAEGLEYTVTGAALPTAARLEGLPAEVPRDLRRFVDGMPDPPPAVRDLLAEAPASPAWRRLDFVRQRLLTTVTAAGAGTPVPVPPEKVADMLVGTKEGTPFEIVAAQAMLARWAGVPARIGYGYDGGDVLSENVREVRPKHGASWLEVWFPEAGWFPVVGSPLKAKPSLNSEGPTSDAAVLASDEIAVQVFIPLRQPQRSLWFEQAQRIFLLALPVVAAVGLVWLLYPAALKQRRRWQRRRWARAIGPPARIEAAYAEFRDWATDLGIGHEWATPLGFLDVLVDDEEHAELAWLVTRALYGDLRDSLEEEDAFAAEELSIALRRRLSAATPLTIRAIAVVSRLSLRNPYAPAAAPAPRRERDAA